MRCPGPSRRSWTRWQSRGGAQRNKLIASLAEYLHSGRHVAVVGPAAGTFPVDHQDAAFAINMMKTLLAYLDDEFEKAYRWF